MMVRRETLEKAGPMPEIYFLYYEELDWSVRIREQGRRIVYDPRCTVFHKESATTGQQSPLRSYCLTRNRLLFAWRNLRGGARLLSVAYQLCIAAPKTPSRRSRTGAATSRKPYAGAYATSSP